MSEFEIKDNLDNSFKKMKCILKLPKIYSYDNFDIKQNKQIILLKHLPKIKKSSFITELNEETNFRHNKNAFSYDFNVNRKKIEFKSRNINKSILFQDYTKKNMLKQLNLKTLSIDLDNTNRDKIYQIFSSFRTATFEGEKQLFNEIKEENEKYINNYKDFYKKKFAKKIKLKPIKIKFGNSKNKISEKLKKRAKCYLNYLKENNIHEINITSEKMEEAENNLNNFYNKVKKKTEKEFDKIYKEEIFT